jgi:phenylpropionate dioxygenase-like ring-hydroxylating dioxygenase large terminal subunit
MSPDQPANEPVFVSDSWYAIAPSAALSRSRPRSLERLGRRWVAWRDAEGKAALLPAACPHRGADLSLGRVEAGEIECPYHGFRFTGEGRCTAMPCEGRDAKIPSRLRASAPIVREDKGLVWLWYGEAREQLPGLPWIADAPEPTRATTQAQFVWPVSFTRLMEGMQDVHHLPFAHRKIDPWRRARLDPTHTAIERDEDGVERIHSTMTIRHEHEPPERGFGFDIHTAFPGVIRLGLGPRLVGTIAACPVDDEHTWFWVCYAVQTGLGALVDRVASALSLWFEFRFVQPDDLRMMQSSQPSKHGIQDLVLVRADEPIAAWHKLRRQRIAGHPQGARLVQLRRGAG